MPLLTYSAARIASKGSGLIRRGWHRALIAALLRTTQVCAGSGRLSYLLNATGLVRVLATDPSAPLLTRTPYSPDVEQLDAAAAIRRHRPALVLCAWMEFGCDWSHKFREAGVDEYVLIGEIGARHAPAAARKVDVEGVPGFQVLGNDGRVCFYPVAEYERLAGSLCYSLCREDHEGYERRLLEDVSAELLHIKDAEDGEAERMRRNKGGAEHVPLMARGEAADDAHLESIVAAVSFRRVSVHVAAGR